MVKALEIETGFKKTEAGVIPNDWVVKPLGEVVDFLDGKRRPIKDSDRAKMRGQYPYYGASGVIDFVNDYIFDEELILLGEDGENILSRNVRLAFKISGKVWVNNHAHVLKPKEESDINYLTEKLESIHYEQYNTGTAQPKLNQNTCWAIPIALPPTKAEQTAIATALNDADALITQLEKLIAKKRNIKQGTMQELLKPKDGWEVKKLGEIGNCFAGGTPSTFNPSYWNGNIIWLPSGRVQNCILKKQENEITITKIGLDESAAKLIKLNSVLIAITGATCGNIGLLNFPAAANQSVIAIEPNEQAEYRFLYYSLLMKRKEILTLQTGSAQGGVNLKSVKNLEVDFPMIEEQNRIARILADMDAEIEALEKKLEKYNMIKQGMMQNLLTGRIRLV